MRRVERSSLEFAALLGTAIVALSYSMCGVTLDAQPPAGKTIPGFAKDAPEYVRVTEGRDGPGPLQRKEYSSCADQPHAILERLGVREHFLNRASLKQWRIEQSIQLLQHPACPFATLPTSDPSWRPEPGTLGLIWTTGYDAHALVFLGPGSDSGHIRTGNYGAGGMSEALFPGADVADSPCVWDDKTHKLLVGGAYRALHSVIRPCSIVPYISAQIDLSGAAVSDELIEVLGARYDD